MIRATKALVAELIGDPEKGAAKTERDVLLSTLRAAERVIESSPLDSAAKDELPAGAESIRERALSDGDSAQPMRILAEWRSRAIAEVTESRRFRPEIGTAIRAIAEPKSPVQLHVTQFNKDSSDGDTGYGGSRGTDAAVAPAARFNEMENCALSPGDRECSAEFLAAAVAAESIMSERFAESARKAAKEEHAGESPAWIAGDLLCRPASWSR